MANDQNEPTVEQLQEQLDLAMRALLMIDLEIDGGDMMVRFLGAPGFTATPVGPVITQAVAEFRQARALALASDGWAAVARERLAARALYASLVVSPGTPRWTGEDGLVYSQKRNIDRMAVETALAKYRLAAGIS